MASFFLSQEIENMQPYLEQENAKELPALSGQALAHLEMLTRAIREEAQICGMDVNMRRSHRDMDDERVAEKITLVYEISRTEAPDSPKSKAKVIPMGEVTFSVSDVPKHEQEFSESRIRDVVRQISLPSERVAGNTVVFPLIESPHHKPRSLGQSGVL